DYSIYMIYEGRRLWPRGLSAALEKRAQARIAKMIEVAEANRNVDPAVTREIYWRLRMYPIESDGKFVAQAPTRLGNIVMGFEQYSLSRYGMDSVFFWYRLRILMDKDAREDM